MQLNKYIDHTLLKPTATTGDIERLCQEAREYEFHAVCVNPLYVPFARQCLRDSSVKVCTVIGFPLGANSPLVKQFEAEQAKKAGADELDMVIDIGAAVSARFDFIFNEIRMILSVGLPVKVIVETGLIGKRLVQVCEMARDAGATFVKTCTGFNGGEATIEAVRTMRQYLPVKASGGIQTREQALALIDAGATRIGTSRGVELCK